MGRPKLSYANVTATLALFLAISGGAYAAAKLPAHSVGTKQLVNSSVTGIKVKNGSLTAADFAPGTLPAAGTGAAGAQGPAGPTGPAGAKGDKGAKGDPGVSGVEIVNRQGSPGSGAFLQLTAPCPAGKKAIGGGFASTANDGRVRASRPTDDDTGWFVELLGQVSGAQPIVTAYAVCAVVGP